MSLTKGTPASSQIVWLEGRVKELEQQRDELLFALRYIQEQHHLGHIHDTASTAIAKVKEQK